MIGKRLHAVWSLGLALFAYGCGTDTPPDAVIKAVEADRTTIYTLVVVPTQVVDGAIHFKVQASATETGPIPNAKVELSGTSPSVGDPFSGFVGTLSGGTFLNPGDPNHLSATTNASGVVTALYQFTVPKCSATDDLSVAAQISASIGGSTATWTDSITIKKDATC